jgi:Fe2+ or Zn2+ uptake regulation protein
LRPNPKYRMTHQRQVILSEVRRSHDHPTADEIYEKVRKRLPRISMGTVYRNLDVLASCGLIERLEPGRPQMRFDGNVREHYHMTCARCGRIDDLPISPSDNPIERLENVMGNLTRYGIFGHKLEFIGLCSECLEKGYTYPEDLVSGFETEKETRNDRSEGKPH